MTIDHKFQIGQDVWMLRNNMVRSSAVEAISVVVKEEGVKISYRLNSSAWATSTKREERNIFADESVLFASKEELIASL